MKSWTLWITILALGLGGYAFWSRATAAVPVEAQVAATGKIVEFVDEQARTSLPRTYTISMPFDARIEAIDLIEGTSVSQGQVVARIVQEDLDVSVTQAQAEVERLAASIRENDDTTVEQTSLLQSLRFVESTDRTVEAAVERVKAGLAKMDFANKQLRRFRSLRETSAATEEALNAAELAQVEAAVDYQQDQLVKSALTSIQAATALVPTMVRQYMDRKALARAVLEKEKTQAEARLRQSLLDQTRGEMRSPISGVVLDRHESNERHVPAGTNLLTVGDPTQMEIEVEILSQDVVDIHTGDKVEIHGPAIGPTSAWGNVTRIYPAGFTKVSSLGVEQQRVKIIVGFEPEGLRRLIADRGLGVGYRVHVRVFTAEEDRALVIPRSSLFRGPAGDWQVFAIRDSRARLQSVEVGLMNDELAQITQGVTEGEGVVLAPETTLVDGARVRPVMTQRPPRDDDTRGD